MEPEVISGEFAFVRVPLSVLIDGGILPQGSRMMDRLVETPNPNSVNP